MRATDQRADSVSFVFVNEAKMSDYHGRYVDVPEPTDVLSFPATEEDPSGERDLGDIVICTDVAVRQARNAGHAYGLELEVLALHGILHLLGYDHEGDNGEMLALEERLRPALLAGSVSR